MQKNIPVQNQKPLSSPKSKMVELKPTTTRLPYAQSNPSAPKAAHVHAPKATKISARAPGHPTTLKQTTTSTGASKTLPSYPRSGSPDSEKRSRC
ncbi:hypothetical protein Ptr902_13497 [Pyrenophora tritici-repentis]|nr:hypothetical protein Ptr902_13497 [Pyrenophora tritici-repentis]